MQKKCVICCREFKPSCSHQKCCGRSECAITWHREVDRKWKEKNPELVREQQRRWYRRYKEKYHERLLERARKNHAKSLTARKILEGLIGKDALNELLRNV